jgi:hypothetical protein
MRLGIEYRAEETGSVLLVRDLVDLTARTLVAKSGAATGQSGAEAAGLDWGEILAETASRVGTPICSGFLREHRRCASSAI